MACNVVEPKISRRTTKKYCVNVLFAIRVWLLHCLITGAHQTLPKPRYYRAPEIMLGLPYDTQIDIWSAGTTIFELATGRILFTGKTNNQMLRQMIDVLGGFSARMAFEGEFSRKHFNSSGGFLFKDPDLATHLPEVVPAQPHIAPTKPVLSLLQGALAAPDASMEKQARDRAVVNLAEVINKCLVLDFASRGTPSQVPKSQRRPILYDQDDTMYPVRFELSLKRRLAAPSLAPVVAQEIPDR